MAETRLVSSWDVLLLKVWPLGECQSQHHLQACYKRRSTKSSFLSVCSLAPLVCLTVSSTHNFWMNSFLQPNPKPLNKNLWRQVPRICTLTRISRWSFSSVSQFSRSVVSDSLQPHESQHARPPCLTPTPGVHSNSRPLSRWCHLAISSSVVPFSSCPQPLPASESFPMSQLFAWGGQSTGVSASASFLTKKSQGWSPSEWTGWISLQSKGLSRVFSNTTVQKDQFFGAQPSSQSNSHIHTWPQEKP